MFHNTHLIVVDVKTSLTDILTMLATIAAVFVGWYGLQEWKRQLKGKTNYEIARRYLKASLKLRDAMRAVRNPFVPLQEIEAALKENGLNSEEYKNHKVTNRAVYNIRWKKVIDAWTNLEADLLEAEVSWGAGAVDAQKTLDECVRKLRVAVHQYVDGKDYSGFADEIIFDNGEDDLFSKEVARAISIIEEYLKPHLQ